MIKLAFVLTFYVVADVGHPTSSINGNLNVVGGHTVNITERPYMVAILRSGKFTCGATLIKKDLALTAAHCVTQQIDEFVVRVGSHLFIEGGETIQVAKIKYHENWNPLINDNDLALVWLKSNVINENAIPIKLASESLIFKEGDIVNITGWGASAQGGTISPILETSGIPIIPSSGCEQAYNVRYNTSHMFCAGPHELGGSCNSDQGGPAVKDGVLVGVISYDLGCGEAEFPGAYLSIPAYRKWFEKNANI